MQGYRYRHLTSCVAYFSVHLCIIVFLLSFVTLCHTLVTSICQRCNIFEYHSDFATRYHIVELHRSFPRISTLPFVPIPSSLSIVDRRSLICTRCILFLGPRIRTRPSLGQSRSYICYLCLGDIQYAHSLPLSFSYYKVTHTFRTFTVFSNTVYLRSLRCTFGCHTTTLPH